MELSIDGRTPLPRAGDPPCRRCPKVPASVLDVKQRTGGTVTPADAVEPDDRHRQAVDHFRECAAVGDDFPDDGWVRRHATLLRPIFKLAEDRPLNNLAGAIRLLAGKLQR